MSTTLGKLTPHQRATALTVLRKLAPPLRPADDAPTLERYVVGRKKVTIPSPYGAANSPAAPPLGVGVLVYEVGNEGALNRLRMKGYIAAVVRHRGTVWQTFYEITPEGLAWFRRAQAREIAAREEAPVTL